MVWVVGEARRGLPVSCVCLVSVLFVEGRSGSVPVPVQSSPVWFGLVCEFRSVPHLLPAPHSDFFSPPIFLFDHG